MIHFILILQGQIRRLLLRLLRREPALSGGCRMCGQCCKMLNLSHRGKWIRTGRAFNEIKTLHPEEYERFEIVGRTAGGILTFRCRLQDENNLCSDHETRPGFCRDYPFAGLYFMGGKTLPGCGYRLEIVPSFNGMLKDSLKKAEENNSPSE